MLGQSVSSPSCQAEICLWTADLYIAFALYQYGSLLFDTMTSKLQKDETAGGSSEVAAVVHLQIGAIEGATLGEKDVKVHATDLK